MYTHPQHFSGPARRAREKQLNAETRGYLEGRRLLQQHAANQAVQARAEQQRIAQEQAAAQAAAAPVKPVEQMSNAERHVAQRQFVRSLRIAG
jgi:hypothetical protein